MIQKLRMWLNGTGKVPLTEGGTAERSKGKGDQVEAGFAARLGFRL